MDGHRYLPVGLDDRREMLERVGLSSVDELFSSVPESVLLKGPPGVEGPLSYDFISLIWDRYITWPRARLESWMKDYHQLLKPDCDFETWVRWCDLMGLQRNLKIVGIFARLHYRDGKDGYLELIPRFYDYLLTVLPRYPEFHEFHQFLEQTECAP